MKLLELTEIKQHYYDLYHWAPIAYCCIDAEGRILEANLRAAELFGAPVENLKGQRLTRFVPSEVAHNLCHLQQRTPFNTSDQAPFELRIRSISGPERSVLALLTVAFSGDDATAVGRLTFMDVSDCGRPKRWLGELNPQTTTPDGLEPVGKLAATIAHDFNNLLAGIMASVTLLEFEHTDQFARTEHLNDIRALTERGAQLTRQLLGIARGGRLQLVPLDLNAVIESLADTFQRMHDGLSIRLALVPSNRQLLADRSQIEQLLTNLLRNAYHALGGVGEILVSLDEIELSTLEARHHDVQPGTYFKLSIADHGPGTRKDNWRGDSESFANNRGCTYGRSADLASVHRIVKNHRGFVSVASVPGQGATLVLYLPSSPKVQLVAPTIDQERSKRPLASLLLVDDEEQIARGWSRTLRYLGYEVVAVRSGEQAVEQVRREPARFSLVILDLAMPGMGGRKACDELHKVAPALKILVWSGYCSEGDADDLMAHGCSGFIQKPPSVSALSAKLRELLQSATV